MHAALGASNALCAPRSSHRALALPRPSPGRKWRDDAWRALHGLAARQLALQVGDDAAQRAAVRVGVKRGAPRVAEDEHRAVAMAEALEVSRAISPAFVLAHLCLRTSATNSPGNARARATLPSSMASGVSTVKE